MAEHPRRRLGDNVDPEIRLAISDEVSETRHFLRNEFTAELVKLRADLAAIGQMVQAGNLAQVTENARMQATLEEVKRDVLELKTLPPRVTILEAKTLAAEEVAELRDKLADNRRWLIAAVVIPSLLLVLTLLTLILQHH
jgi:hypothetical protein